jgi:hypothetical protein
MKKILSLLFLSSSLFSMQLALKMQTPRFVKQSVAKVNTVAKDIALTSKPTMDNKKIDLSFPKFKIDSSSIRAPHYMADAQLFHGKKGFVVVHNEKTYLLEKVLMNKEARDMTKKSLKSFIKCGFFSLDQTNDGQFTLKAHYRLPGSGVIGATIGCFLGKAVVSVVGHGLICAVSALTGPAAPATFVALESCFGAAIESASMAGAVAGGVALGAATGPV